MVDLRFKPRLSTKLQNAKTNKQTNRKPKKKKTAYFLDLVYVYMGATSIICMLHVWYKCVCACEGGYTTFSMTPGSIFFSHLGKNFDLEKPDFQSLQQSVLDIPMFKIHWLCSLAVTFSFTQLGFPEI